MIQSSGYAAQAARAWLAPFQFERRDPRPYDVVIEIQYCGVCHSDIHQVRNEWNEAVYPLVPGHEIVGRVLQIGASVKKFKVRDTSGVGVMVDSCRTCASCKAGQEQYCEIGGVLTYNGRDLHTGELTFGGYSNNIVVDEFFVYEVPPNLNPAGVAPLLCGLPDRPLAVQAALLSGKRVSLSGSSIGGVQETQQMLDYCGEKGIVSDIEIIPIQQINEAFERV